MTICNHKEYWNSRDKCPLCYPLYDDEVEERIKKYQENADKFVDDLKKPFYVHGVGSKLLSLPRDSTRLASKRKSQRHTYKHFALKKVRFY